MQIHQSQQLRQRSSIREVMTEGPLTLPETASVTQAARMMRDAGIGAVLVVNGSSELTGVITDRDIVVRVLAAGQDPAQTRIGDIASEAACYLSPEDSIEDAVEMMGDYQVRRLPIVEDGRAIGIVSLGDLAELRAPETALGRISAAPSN
jgi:CBS domain-containing protein